MKKFLKLFLTLALSTSLWTQMSLAVESTGAPAASAASVQHGDIYGADRSVDAIAKQALSNADAESVYSITLSESNAPEDFDIMITRRSGKLYSFKYCKARNADQTLTEISAVRRLRFAKPDFFTNFATSNDLLSHYFNGPNCVQLGNSQIYAEQAHYDINDSHRSATTTSTVLHSIGGAIGTFGGTIWGANAIADISEIKKANNSLGTAKFILTKMPKIAPTLAIGVIGAGLFEFVDAVETYRNNQTIDAVANSSYVYAYTIYVNQYTATKDFAGETVVPSMKTFTENFNKGLGLLLKRHYFIEL